MTHPTPPHTTQTHTHLQVRFALRASIFANVLLSVAGAYAAVSSRSLAVFAALLDTLLDLVSQVRCSWDMT